MHFYEIQDNKEEYNKKFEQYLVEEENFLIGQKIDYFINRFIQQLEDNPIILENLETINFTKEKDEHTGFSYIIISLNISDENIKKLEALDIDYDYLQSDFIEEFFDINYFTGQEKILDIITDQQKKGYTEIVFNNKTNYKEQFFSKLLPEEYKVARQKHIIEKNIDKTHNKKRKPL